MIEFVCPPDCSDRLDKVVAQLRPDTSRSEARRLIAAGSVFVDGRRCRIASRVVHAGERIRVADGVAPQAAPRLAILYEDDDCIAIDKPAGMPSAPTQSAAEGTVLQILREQLRGKVGKPSLWIVHRLDAPTSGVMLLAKTRRAAAQLSEAFRKQVVRKTYVARVQGRPDAESGCIELAIATEKGRALLSPQGRPARTSWRLIETLGETSILELHPQTGRMHQIRVHLQAIGHPVVGDRLYGGVPAARLMLHARRLELPHPLTSSPLTIEAPLPSNLRNQPPTPDPQPPS